MSLILRDCFGASSGRFFGTLKPFVDASLPPGHSRLPRPTLADWVWSAVTLRHVWASPSSLWSIFALVFYFAFPYDLSSGGVAAQGPITWSFFSSRFPLWAFLTLGYTAFWHVTLHVLEWAQRPLVADRAYNPSKVAHNVFYSLSGVAIWTLFDNVMAFLWASGRLPYMPDSEAFSGPAGAVRFFAGLALIPLWRDIHFYFSHRFLHFRPLYRQVHSVHHRNTDIEPFAGLSMHPIEHLYYFACILPNLILYASPFHALWNGVHLLISPAAGHSGYEDHWQANNFHYCHHRYPECAYH
jgi:sterol desaturase/sphingolipid hydroxylase (fatty acid hydroxylase superfamily)